MRSARAWLHASLQQAWEATVSRGEVSFEERADLLLAAANATRSAAAAVDIVYTAAGGTANYRRSSLRRSLRDIRAVTQYTVRRRNSMKGGSYVVGAATPATLYPPLSITGLSPGAGRLDARTAGGIATSPLRH